LEDVDEEDANDGQDHVAVVLRELLPKFKFLGHGYFDESEGRCQTERRRRRSKKTWREGEKKKEKKKVTSP